MTPEATGRHEVREGQDTLVLTRTFRAPIAEIWAAVTESPRMAQWIGTWTGDPTSGVVLFQMSAEGDGGPAQPWEIRACEAPRTLVVRSSDDTGVWELELNLSEHDGITILEFTQVIDDPNVLESVGPGWEYYLDRLVAAETGGEVAAVEFEPGYYPGFGGHYAALMTHEGDK